MSTEQNVYLIGPMGVGKTTIGKSLARQLRLEFFDADQEIEKHTGVSIATIFDIEGEEAFRVREKTMIEKLTSRRGIVLATGGGVILDAGNRNNLRKSGTVVYLHASVDLQFERTRNDKNRPLLNLGDDRRAILESLMAERDPFYRGEADHVIATDGQSPQAVARHIARELMKSWP